VNLIVVGVDRSEGAKAALAFAHEELRRRRLLGRRSMWDPAAWRVTEAGER